MPIPILRYGAQNRSSCIYDENGTGSLQSSSCNFTVGGVRHKSVGRTRMRQGTVRRPSIEAARGFGFDDRLLTTHRARTSSFIAAICSSGSHRLSDFILLLGFAVVLTLPGLILSIARRIDKRVGIPCQRRIPLPPDPGFLS